MTADLLKQVLDPVLLRLDRIAFALETSVRVSIEERYAHSKLELRTCHACGSTLATPNKKCRACGEAPKEDSDDPPKGLRAK